MKFPDIARLLEGRHGAAKLVSLAAGKAGPDNGNLHRLFLKQRHAKRTLQHAAKRVRRIGHLFQPGASAQIGMHHVPWIGPGRTIATCTTRSWKQRG